jgi:hypothetical protein
MAERKKLLLRLDPQVHDAIARWAADDLRSVNAQIEFLLRRALRAARRYGRGDASSDASSGAANAASNGDVSDDDGSDGV